MANKVKLRIWLPKARIEKSTIVREVFGAGAQAARSTALGVRNGSTALRKGGGPRAAARHSSAGAGHGGARGVQRILDVFGLELGHASIRLPGAFVGYWGPQETLGEEGRAILTEDDEDEQIDREPDKVFDLTGLDVDAMKKAWKTAKHVDYHPINHNCCTVCFRVIKAGVDGKRAKMSTLEWIGHGFGESVVSMFRPIPPASAVTGEAAAENVLAWTPALLKDYAKYVRDVFLKV